MLALEQELLGSYQVSELDLEKSKRFQARNGGRLEHILVNMGSLTEDDLITLYAKVLNVPIFDASKWQEWKPSDVDRAKLSALEKFDALLLSDQNELLVATKDPLDIQLNEYLSNQLLDVKLEIAKEADLQAFFYNVKATEGDLEEELELSGDEEAKLRELAVEAPTVNLLNTLITKALARGASDMHLEPYNGRYRVRYRIDGVLITVEYLAANMQMPIITRLKILSGMDIAEKRRPQDGKIEMRIANQDLDIRVSALPLNESESIVLRFLKKDAIKYDMSVLGLSADTQLLVQKDLAKTTGVILLTGPTGSGKTTTLYTFLNELNCEDVKIITLEDPVEYQLEGINQVHVNPEIGFDFAAGLRSIVRQDPDIIMVGEIRDAETARIALQSALTGHLVFSTVHTNDAASAYTRLLDLGVDEFLLNAALVSIVAQRLARKVCQQCAKPASDASALMAQHKLSDLAQRMNIQELNLVEAVGCESCNHTGYKGRIAINEYLRCDDEIKQLPKDDQFIPKAQAHNQSLNGRNLLEDGFYKALQGITTVDEVLRVAG